MRVTTLLGLCLFAAAFLMAAKPRYPNPSSPDQVWQNDNDLYDEIGARFSIVESTGTMFFSPSGSTTAVISSTYFTGVRVQNGVRFNFTGNQRYTNTTVDSSTVTLSPGSVKVFTIELANGDGALCYSNYLSGTITVLGSAGNISNTTTPAAGNFGVNKSANSHVINFVTGSAASGTFASWSICFLGTNVP